MDDLFFLDMFLLSVIGGALGGIIMSWAGYHYTKSLYLKYFKIKDSLITTVELNRLKADIEILKSKK